MANKFRYRRGATDPVIAAVITAEAIEISDLVGLSSGNLYPAADHPWGATAGSGAQFNFAANFLGSAAQAKAADSAGAHGGGADNRLRVNTGGVFEYDCFGTTHEIGALLGPAIASTGSSLESQKVEDVSTDKTRAIGVCVGKKSTASLTTVLVKIFSRKVTMALDQT